jgi:hypothetical protein
LGHARSMEPQGHNSLLAAAFGHLPLSKVNREARARRADKKAAP